MCVCVCVCVCASVAWFKMFEPFAANPIALLRWALLLEQLLEPAAERHRRSWMAFVWHIKAIKTITFQ